MKKVSLFLGMVLAASFAMAQNTATTVQNGDGNGAALTQTGTSNTGVVYQLLGDDNSGTLIQTGVGNDATIIQGLTSVAGAIRGTQDLGANENVGYISQIGGNNNNGEVYQVGDRNNGQVYINGTGNTAQMQQGWSDWDGGYATYGNSNYSVLSQTGTDNIAYTWQYGGVKKDIGVFDNVNNITQNGDRNFATVAQGYIYPVNGKGIIPIYGVNVTGNTSNIIQGSTKLSYDNIARFFQLGKTNIISLTQNGNGNKVGEYTTVGGVSLNGYFYQTGDGNKFYGTQTDGATLDKTSAQTGDDNYINMVQGQYDVAKIIQDGDLNQAYLTQYGGGQNATILQTGDSNISSVTQGN
jgi:hypothetical protein